MNRGLFITFEGIDGCGKSTQIDRVARLLRDELGIEPVVTREPGGTVIGEAIRKILIDPVYKEMGTETELLLYLASRAQHVEEKILPALESGKMVLCDRFQAATFAYQGYGRGLSLEILRQLNSFSTKGIAPDCTLVFDISVECSLRRLSAMNKCKDRLESCSTDFFEKIREGYRALASADPTVVLLDGEKGLDELTGLVYSQITQVMSKDLP